MSTVIVSRRLRRAGVVGTPGEPYRHPPLPPRLRRNARCWCGSGRKHKRCHHPEAAAAAVPPQPQRSEVADGE